LILLSSPIPVVSQSSNSLALNQFETSPLEVSFSSEVLRISQSALNSDALHVGLADYPNSCRVGEPMLPMKRVFIALPPQTTVETIAVHCGKKHTMVLEGIVEQGQKQTPDITTTSSSPSSYIQPNPKIYSSSNLYPGILYEDKGIQICKGYTVLLIDLYPVQYQPAANQLVYYDSLQLQIHTQPSHTQTTTCRGLQADYDDIKTFVENPEQLELYQTSYTTLRETIEYVIITSDEFASAFHQLTDWKETRGQSTPLSNITTRIVTLSDIIQNSSFWYNGYWGDGSPEIIFNDTQCLIRNFIKMAYHAWGTRFVLLGGDADEPIIPHRGMYVYTDEDPGYTDYDIPCDMYYGCLDGTWDADCDGIFGETPWHGTGVPPPGYENGSNGEEADFFAEVSIGRAPVDSLSEIQHFIRKTITYELDMTNQDHYLSTAVMIGPRSDWQTERGNSEDAVLGIVPQYSPARSYTRDGTFNTTLIALKLNSGTHIVLYSGHANNLGFEGVNVALVRALTNLKYCFVYNGGCYSASFDNRDFYGGYLSDAVGEEFVTCTGGAFAYIGNSRYGWYEPGCIQGKNDRFTRSFFQICLDTLKLQGLSHLGTMLQLSKERIPLVDCYDRWTVYTLTLLGDPETQLALLLSTPTAHLTTAIEKDAYLLFPPTYHGIVSILGDAHRGETNDSTFEHYTLEYGSGNNPTVWSTANISLTHGGYEEIYNDVLATWDTRYLKNGPYALRLSVYNQEGFVCQDTLVVMVSSEASVLNQESGQWYWSIQDAVTDANPGDTLVASPRIYYESIFINKPLILRGENSSSTILDGFSIRDIIRISGHNVTVSGFTFKHSGQMLYDIFAGVHVVSNDSDIANNYFNGTSYGVCLQETQRGTVSMNTFLKNTYGVIVYSPEFFSSQNTVEKNTIIGNTYSPSGTGIALVGSSNNTIYRNTISKTHTACELIFWSNDNSVSENMMSENTNGVRASIAFHNTFFENTIRDNRCGVTFTAGSEQNLVYHNNLKNENNAIDAGANTWNREYISGGNYWNNYTGEDHFSGPGQNLSSIDGIGDEPFVLLGRNITDQYPYITENGWLDNYPPLEPHQPIPHDFSALVNVYSSLQWKGGDPDEDPVTYDVYFGTTNPPLLVVRNTPLNMFQPGLYLPGGHMAGNTKYYWKIVAHDFSHITEGRVWCFKTALTYEISTSELHSNET